MNEGELLEHIYDRSRKLCGSFSQVVVGPGDDCAVVRSASGDELLLSVDQLIAGRHFEPDEAIERIAYKAVARSVSDIAAMGGVPNVALAAAALPGNYTKGDELFDAMHAAAAKLGCPLVGGDIAMTEGALTLSVTVIGAPIASRGPVLRSDAKLGDGLYVTGKLGGSLASGRHLTFTPRVAEGQWLCETLGGRLGAMIDLSDGIGIDAGRMATASGVRIEINADRLPIHADAVGPMNETVDKSMFAISSGEDYELCFTARGDVPGTCPATGTIITRVGTVVEAQEDQWNCVFTSDTDEPTDASETGWQHRGVPRKGRL